MLGLECKHDRQTAKITVLFVTPVLPICILPQRIPLLQCTILDIQHVNSHRVTCTGATQVYLSQNTICSVLYVITFKDLWRTTGEIVPPICIAMQNMSRSFSSILPNVVSPSIQTSNQSALRCREPTHNTNSRKINQFLTVMTKEVMPLERKIRDRNSLSTHKRVLMLPIFHAQSILFPLAYSVTDSRATRITVHESTSSSSLQT